MTDNITLPREVVEKAFEALMISRPRRSADRHKVIGAIEALRTALAAEPTKPSGYAYRHADGALWFNNGCSVNGGLPVEVVPYWFAPPALAAEQPSEDAERYRWLQDAGQKYWMEFADMTAEATEAAIDAAMGDKR